MAYLRFVWLDTLRVFGLARLPRDSRVPDSSTFAGTRVIAMRSEATALSNISW